jgi:YXWGXW repeat-containing protein
MTPLKNVRAGRRLVGAALIAAWLGFGCYQAPPPAYPAQAAAPADATAYPTSPPPDPVPEAQPPPPGYGYAWIGGYWDWTGYDWSWNPGYWAPQDSAYLYIGPRFVFMDGRPVYYRPYWQGPGGRRVFGYGYRGRPPEPGWRARPSVAPGAWRAEPAHNAGWRASPGAGAWRGAPTRGAPMRAAPAPMRGAPTRAAPAPMRAAPAPVRAAPAPMRAAPARGGGGRHVR